MSEKEGNFENFLGNMESQTLLGGFSCGSKSQKIERSNGVFIYYFLY